MHTVNPVGVRLCVPTKCLQIDAQRSRRYSHISPLGDEDAADARDAADYNIPNIINKFSGNARFWQP